MHMALKCVMTNRFGLKAQCGKLKRFIYALASFQALNSLLWFHFCVLLCCFSLPDRLLWTATAGDLYCHSTKQVRVVVRFVVFSFLWATPQNPLNSPSSIAAIGFFVPRPAVSHSISFPLQPPHFPKSALFSIIVGNGLFMHARKVNPIWRAWWTQSNSLFTDQPVKSIICCQRSSGSRLSWPLSASLLQYDTLLTAFQRTSTVRTCPLDSFAYKPICKWKSSYTGIRCNLFMQLRLFHVVNLCPCAARICFKCSVGSTSLLDLRLC